MGQSVWHRDDIARIGQVLITTAPSMDYAAGVAALCAAVGASVKMPKRRDGREERKEIEICQTS